MVTVLLAGCAASSVEPEKKDDEVVIATEKEEPVAEETKPEVKHMKYVGLKVYDPVYVALEKGFFEGVDVELVDVVAGGATAVEMVASGDV